MALTLVTGGTGHLGGDIVDRLVRAGHRVRVFARSPGARPDVEWASGDLATGAGLRAALHDVDTVINAATYSPIARRGGIRPIDFFRSPSAVDVEGTERLLAVSGEAQVRHFLHVSIVGLDEATLPYARVKLAGEWLVRASDLSWSVVRAMPFYYLLDRLLSGLSWLPVWPMPTARFNPVDTTDVANHVVACAFDGQRGVRAEIGGPEALDLVALARQYQDARRLHRKILPIDLSEAKARGMGFVVSQGVRGRLTWADWLRRNDPGTRSAA
ncbi:MULTISPECIES: SDR family oxidoreductase [Bradyrhizobium]|uniref:Epimerase n=1 Tax=Bradyrhizobium arachidis TaxID=858423 RepID=A0AAE7TF28_9BRAD|nr:MULTISPECIES: NAD(P)H-binding protein [Bradyrhizobium]QOG16035.1 NAD(P)H-binding protein [Bradyrhizobium sp. SEMIA]QOZ65231.1 epimerase [Bradyrhizobium arachidis]UFW49756.1 NAD(P)H-binding protein [Bradyrhizobium arachidis]SFU28946.1 Nucleoside-diphosphate-sugar epimerase [Bradyrhizobium arachidis]